MTRVGSMSATTPERDSLYIGLVLGGHVFHHVVEPAGFRRSGSDVHTGRKRPSSSRAAENLAAGDFVPAGGGFYSGRWGRPRPLQPVPAPPEIVSAGEEHGHDRGEAARGDLTVKAAEDRQAGLKDMRPAALWRKARAAAWRQAARAGRRPPPGHSGRSRRRWRPSRVGGRLGPEVGGDGGEDGHHRNHRDSDDGRHEKDEDEEGRARRCWPPAGGPPVRNRGSANRGLPRGLPAVSPMRIICTM